MSSNSDWITVGALAEGFAPEAFILPALADLAGRSVTLNFAKVLVDYQPQKADGTKDGGPVKFGWNIRQNVKV